MTVTSGYKPLDALGGEPVAGVEGEPVGAGEQGALGDQAGHAAVGVGDAADRGSVVAGPGLHGDSHAGGRPPAGGVQDVVVRPLIPAAASPAAGG
jgi:hypothetical protein